MNVIIRDNPEAMEKRIRAILKLKDTKVNVGLLPSAGGRLHFILAVQSHGSPVMHIPARPVVRPALSQEEVRAAMAGDMLEAVKTAWEGKDPHAALQAAGQDGADGIRQYIDSGVLQPNSPVTVSGGWIFNRVARKGVYVPGKGFNKPLVDSGALYSAFDYEIEE